MSYTERRYFIRRIGVLNIKHEWARRNAATREYRSVTAKQRTKRGRQALTNMAGESASNKNHCDFMMLEIDSNV